MREFFRGWRRKVGCVTLVMALALTGAWIRSSLVQDEIYLLRPERVYAIQSSVGGIQWENHSPSFVFPGGGSFHWISRTMVYPSERHWRSHVLEENVCWDCAGFVYYKAIDSTPLSRTVEIWRGPYWSLVVPLTMLSSYLLLCPPRKRKAKSDA